MFAKPAVDIVKIGGLLGQNGSFAKWRSRVRQLPEFAGFLPVAALAEEMDTPGKGQIRGLITSAGNPVLSTPNGARLERALGGLEYMVSIDLYVNETTRFANLILPPPSALERDHYDIGLRALGVRNSTRYTKPVFAADSSAREDWQIYAELGSRVARKRGGAAGLVASARMSASQWMGPRRMLDWMLRLGPYGVPLSSLEGEQHTRDLGPLAPCLPDRLMHKPKVIQLAPDIYLEDLWRLARFQQHWQPNGLVLIGRRQLRSNNSWMHRYERLSAACTARIHPADAAARAIRDGDAVEIRSRAGAIVVAAELSDRMLQGVVSVPHGFGRSGSSASVNDVTDEGQVDALSGVICFNGVPVSVTRHADVMSR